VCFRVFALVKAWVGGEATNAASAGASQQVLEAEYLARGARGPLKRAAFQNAETGQLVEMN
jgi:hypothetical protein